MTVIFWIVATILLAGALTFLLPALLSARVSKPADRAAELNVSVYQDQLRELAADLRTGTVSADQFAEAKRDIERRVLEEGVATVKSGVRALTGRPAKSVAIATAALVPLVAVGLYILLGNPAALDDRRAAPAAADGNHGLNQQQIIGLVAGLAARLKDNPDDGEGWAMLARSYGVLGRHQDALIAYQNAVQRIDRNAQLLVDYADTLALVRGRKLAGEPYELVKRALAIDARNLKGLALAGTAELEAGNPAAAIPHWEAILKLVPAEAPLARSISASLAQARQQIATRGVATVQATGAAPSAAITGIVALSPALAGRVAATDTLFVFARAAEGSRMPLAILKRTAGELPLQFRLDDTMSMGPAAKLSTAGRVVVGARISRSGTAAPQSGDLEATSVPAAVGGEAVNVVIEKVLP